MAPAKKDKHKVKYSANVVDNSTNTDNTPSTSDKDNTNQNTKTTHTDSNELDLDGIDSETLKSLKYT